MTAHTLRAHTRERKIQNLLALTGAHREIWARLYEKPELVRILDLDVDLAQNPVTLEEELLVRFLILHLNVSFKARKTGMEFDDDAVALDIRQFFSRPIPLRVWTQFRVFQSPDFVEFVEANF